MKSGVKAARRGTLERKFLLWEEYGSTIVESEHIEWEYMTPKQWRVRVSLFAKWLYDRGEIFAEGLAALKSYLMCASEDVSLWAEEAFMNRLRNSLRGNSREIGLAKLDREKDAVPRGMIEKNLCRALQPEERHR